MITYQNHIFSNTEYHVSSHYPPVPLLRAIHPLGHPPGQPCESPASCLSQPLQQVTVRSELAVSFLWKLWQPPFKLRFHFRSLDLNSSSPLPQHLNLLPCLHSFIPPVLTNQKTYTRAFILITISHYKKIPFLLYQKMPPVLYSAFMYAI